MGQLKGFANVVFPARDLEAGIAAWSAVLGEAPAFQGPDFAVFTGGGVEVGLTAAPWVDHPLVFWKVDDIEQAHRALVAAGATPLGEVGRRVAGRARHGGGHKRRPGHRDRRRSRRPPGRPEGG